GTVRARGLLANPKGTLIPGLFARVRMEVGKPRKALVIPWSGPGTGGGNAMVYVVDDKNTVEMRKVVLGTLQDGLRVVNSGLKLGERVIIDGHRGLTKKLQTGDTVQPRSAPQ